MFRDNTAPQRNRPPPPPPPPRPNAPQTSSLPRSSLPVPKDGGQSKIPAAAATWARPGAYMTIGTTRYGVRVATTTGSVRNVAPPRGDAVDDDDCCCVPSTPINRRGGIFSFSGKPPVYRDVTSMQQQAPPRRVLVRPKPELPAYLKLCTSSSSSSDTGDTRRLLRDESDEEAAASQRLCNTLDRLPRFRFGGGSSSDDGGGGEKRPSSGGGKKQRSSDKAERLRELTERLKGSSSSPDRRRLQQQKRQSPPPPPPLPPSPQPPPTPPPPPASPSPSPDPTPHKDKEEACGMKEDDIFECVNLRLNKPESRPVVGAYAQRTIPFRSASFSQVDFSAADGKYIRSNTIRSLTLPRKRPPEVSSSPLESTSTIISPSSSSLTAEEPEPAVGSTPSVDSAVGSDEGYATSAISKIPVKKDGSGEGDSCHKTPGSRSLTYPLPRRGSRPDDDIPFSSIDGNGLKSLQQQQQEDAWRRPEQCHLTLQPPVCLGQMVLPEEEWCGENTTTTTHVPSDGSEVADSSEKPCKEEVFVTQWPPPPTRADSLSEEEQPSPRDNLSDSETPRRYSKRPLRGPYGQMLEAEMSKAETHRIPRVQLDFLDTPPAPRALATQSLDDSQLGRPGSARERKVSAPQQHHQRTTSSPSQLENFARPEPTPELLAELLRGSSERICTSRDTRTHVVVELYDTERSYVESLQILVMKYLQPLKSPENAGLVDAALVDDIFYQVPAILAHHEVFLEELRKRLEHWDVKQKVGDVFLNVFTKQAVIESYTAFINNWKNAKEAIKTTCQAKPAFARFLEAMAREHKGKLALDCLLIMPVQRIPRYELLIQTLLKHTDVNHPDHQLLLEAQREVHELAVKINCTERETLELEQQQQTLKELEALIEGLINLVSPERTFIRHDLVTMISGQGTRKERALFLFSDLLVITSIKRRSGTIRKPSTSCQGSVASTLEANKYKLLMRIPLDDLEIVKAKDENLRRMLREMENLAEDMQTLTQMSELVTTLHCPHGSLEELVREMLMSVNKQLSERQNSDSQLSYLELTLNTQNGIENISVVFTKPDKRTSWEESFNEAKQKLALSADKRQSPEFLSPLPIRKTRAGLQFTCAAPTLGLNAHNMRDVWVCNSDGYVGQVCVLSLQPEPTVISCNGVCNARILCIASIPAGFTSSSCPTNSPQQFINNSKTGISISVEEVDDSSGNRVHLDSSSSSEEEEEVDEGVKAEEDPKCMRSVSDPMAEDADNLQPTMWLGTEDGCIHVYNCSDNIRIKKNKVRIQHGSSVHCIIYLDNRVFVSLANGDISVYARDHNGAWNTTEPTTVSVGTAAMPVTRMLPISGKLWCGCHNSIKILNTLSLEIEHSFQVNSDSNRAVTCMAHSGLGVWISLQNSAVIRLFHATSYESLCDVNVAPAVTKMLASCDDIIRQHKAACLRVTSLLACKDLLWIGTSAGVILTMALPHITSSTTKISSVPNVAGVPHGHTGHVRFLTYVETAPTPSTDSLLVHHRYSLKNKMELQGGNNMKVLVISGGDGYEDFRTSGISEVAGREDSTNHLLLWHM